MHNPGFLSGRGRLFDGSEEIGPVSYRIQIRRGPKGRETGEGHLEGTPRVVGKVFRARNAVLRTQGGGIVAIVPRGISGNRVSFTTFGPVPEV